MSYASKTALTTVVPLSAGYSATVKKLRKDEGLAARSALLAGVDMIGLAVPAASHNGHGPQGAEAPTQIDQVGYTDALLVAGITAWDLDGDEGDDMDENGILRITVPNLKKLSDEDSQALVTAIQSLTPALSEGEKKEPVTVSSSSSN